MKRRDVRKHRFGSPGYVLAHAKYQSSRGRQPAAALKIFRRAIDSKPDRIEWNARAALKRITRRGQQSTQKPRWRLEGYDTLDGCWYSLPGVYHSELAVLRYADQQLEESQPSSSSGGQGGIQDEVWIVRHDGTKRRHNISHSARIAA